MTTVTYYGTFSPYTPTEFPMAPPVPEPVWPDLTGAALVAAQAEYERLVAERELILNRLRNSVAWIRNENGEDLYELRKSLPTTGTFVTLNADDTIRVTHDDPHKIWPADNGRLYHVDLALPISGVSGPTPGLEGKLFDTVTGAISDPPPAPVNIVTAGQAKVALFRTKKILDDSERGFALSRDPTATGTDLLTLTKAILANYPPDVQLWYESARDWERENPYVLGIGIEIGLTDQEMNELFTYASTLST